MKLAKYISIVIISAWLCIPNALYSQAADLNSNFVFTGDDNTDADTIANIIGIRTDDPKQIAVDIMYAALEFLGLVAVIITLSGGFMWMTSAGSKEKIEKAKRILWAGAIGIIVILSAMGIATFVIRSWLWATGVTP
ncbi:MAG: hypothetical protein Q8Q23_05075 [bacterium]|nr:hypothetical protein [bacterium]